MKYIIIDFKDFRYNSGEKTINGYEKILIEFKGVCYLKSLNAYQLIDARIIDKKGNTEIIDVTDNGKFWGYITRKSIRSKDKVKTEKNIERYYDIDETQLTKDYFNKNVIDNLEAAKLIMEIE